MNWDYLELHWDELHDRVKQRWDRLALEQVSASRGKHQQLVEEIRRAYGVSTEEAERQVAEWQPSQDTAWDSEVGEGNYRAAKVYDDAAAQFVASGRVASAAAQAEPHGSAEAAEMQAAEEIGRSKARGEDPAIAAHYPPAATTGLRSQRVNPAVVVLGVAFVLGLFIGRITA